MEEDIYDILADHYDIMQDDIDPDELALRIKGLIDKYCTTGNEKKSLVDLGCGSGSVTSIMQSRCGFDCIGIDLSPKMLNMAMEKNDKVLWLCQDMTEYELLSPADVFISTTNTMDHLTDRSLFEKILSSFEKYLLPGGVFVFDVGTREYFEEVLGDNVFFEDYDDMTLLWANEYDREEGVSTSELTLFYTEDGENYKRTDGTLYERFYSEDEIREMAEGFGLEFLTGIVSEDGRREFMVLRKN